MDPIRSRALAALAVLALSGCASFPQQAYDKQHNAQVHRIAILTPAVPAQTRVWMAVHPGQNFGLIGALVAANDTANKTDDFDALARGQGFAPEPELVGALRAALVAKGFEVSVVQLAGREEDGKFLEDYPPVPDIDAYLDAYARGFGYMAAGATTPYRPSVFLAVRLVSASAGDVLFADQVAYNPFGDDQSVAVVPMAPGYEYPDAEALSTSAPQAVQGLRGAVAAVAGEIARQLR